MLPAKESLVIYERFMNNERVDFALLFANGEYRQFKVPTFVVGNFEIWAAMFQTCIRENHN